MYSVSERFKEEIIKPQRITRIIGRIHTAAGVSYTITDENVITGSLKITDQLGSGEFSIGGVYARNMTIKLLGFSNITDVSNLSNARIILRFRLVYSIDSDGNEDYEDVPLGVFNVDGSKTKRKFDTVTLTATDDMQNFDRDAEPNENITLYNAVVMACIRCGVALKTSSDEFSEFPNGDITVSYTTDQIQTWRDLLMWIGELTGTFARINLGGALEFVRMTAETGSDGRIIPVMEIPPDVRFTTDFSDTTIRVPKVIMRRGNVELSHSISFSTSSISAMVATMELNDNPLIADKTDDEVSGYLKKLANYLITLLHRPFETSFNGNPALQVGDYVRLRGGAIDISQAYATGIITYSCWRYRGKHDIKCKSFTTTVRQSDSNTIALMSEDYEITPLDDSPAEIMRKPKSQIEKRIDALEGAGGSGGVGKATEDSPTSEYFNDYTNNTARGNYHHTEGQNNKNEGGTATHVDGSGNQAYNSNYSTVSGIRNVCANDLASGICGSANVASGSQACFVFGMSNVVNSARCTLVSGSRNNVGSMDSIISGSDNICKNCDASLVQGSNNTIEQSYNGLIVGKNNSVYAYGTIAIIGDNNMLGASNNTLNYVYLVGHDLIKEATNNMANPQLILGQYNQDGYIDTGQRVLVFAIGNGSDNNNRSTGFAVDQDGVIYCNRVVQTGTTNIFDVPLSATASAQAARAITSAASAGIPIILLDHAPIAEDLTGSECVFLQCEDTAEVEGETTGIFRVTDIFAEKSFQ